MLLCPRNCIATHLLHHGLGHRLVEHVAPRAAHRQHEAGQRRQAPAQRRVAQEAQQLHGHGRAEQLRGTAAAAEAKQRLRPGAVSGGTRAGRGAVSSMAWATPQLRLCLTSLAVY